MCDHDHNNCDKNHNSKRTENVILIAVVIGFVIFLSFFTHKSHERDCIPHTLHRIFPNVSLDDIYDDCHTTDEGTTLTNMFLAWKKLTTNNLYASYSLIKEISIDTNNNKIQFDYPYLWIGNAFNDTNKFAGHCCLVKINETNVISHDFRKKE